MTAEIIDGKAFAGRLRVRIGAEVAGLRARHGLVPGLAVVLVGDDPASDVYVRSKGRLTIEAGMHSEEHRLDAATPEAEVLALIGRLNRDPRVHGILVQLPLPAHIDEARVVNAVAAEKDVDGFHVNNVARLASGRPATVPCTPLGCLMLLRERLGDLAGLEAVVLGRSNIVGRPMAALLLAENCTVTVAHSRTRDAAAVCARADILVAAVGRPGLVTRRLGQAGCGGDRRGHQPADRGGRQGQDRRRRGLRQRRAGRRRDHAGAGRGGADDHRLPSGQHAGGVLPQQRAARAGGAGSLNSGLPRPAPGGPSNTREFDGTSRSVRVPYAL